MDILKKDFKYKIVKNFLSPEERKIGLRYLLLKHKKNTTNFDYKQNNNLDTYLVRDDFTDALLMEKLNRMEKETGLKLIPTYCFSRVYSYNAVLTEHTDRPACEISISINWGSCGTKWPLYMDGVECNMEPGDGLIYLGCDLKHKREYFTGDYAVQSFLHYVDKEGPYTSEALDKKDALISPVINYDEYKKYVG